MQDVPEPAMRISETIGVMPLMRFLDRWSSYETRNGRDPIEKVDVMLKSHSNRLLN